MAELPTDLPPDTELVRDALRRVMDPEAGMNIVDLGLVYGIEVRADTVAVDLTMTSPACPLGDVILEDAAAVLNPLLPAAMRLELRLVWSPPWDPSRMSEAARRHFDW